MTFDLKAQPASISSAICGLRRIIIVFSFFKLIKWKIKWKWKMYIHANSVGSVFAVSRGLEIICFSFIEFGSHFWTLPENTNFRFGQVDYLLLLKPISLDNAIQEFSLA